MNPKLDSRDRLVESADKPLGQRVPAALHERVERLCDEAFAAGEPVRPSKMTMIAAVLLAAPTDGAELRALLRRYGEATVGEALPGEATGDMSIIELPRRKSGPRAGRASGRSA
jgi:hypothetical protein